MKERGFSILSGLFNYDNPIWRFIGKFWDLLIIHILWVICCIPIVTVGAATTAMYYVTLRLVRDDDGYTIRSFFKSFKENFKQATIIWMLFLVIGLILGFDVYFVATVLTTSSTFRTVLATAFLAMLFIWLAMFTYVFPLQARFYNTVKRTIFNAFFMSIRHIFHTIAMIAIAAGMIFLTFTVVPQLMLFGVPLIAFVNSYILEAIFKKYIPKDERADEKELRPLFENEEDTKSLGQIGTENSVWSTSRKSVESEVNDGDTKAE